MPDDYEYSIKKLPGDALADDKLYDLQTLEPLT